MNKYIIEELAVSEIMSTNLITVDPETSAKYIDNIFKDKPFRHLPVVEEGNVIGIISKEDMRQLSQALSFNTTGKTLSTKMMDSITAREIMTPGPICIDSAVGVQEAADIFLKESFHCLPVVENGKIVGILTTIDLLRYAFK